MVKISRLLPFVVVILAFLGLLDSLYLTVEHYSGVIPPCTIHWWLTDCGKVLRSSYSEVFGIPLALIGVIHYSIEGIVALFAAIAKKRWVTVSLVGLSIVGAISSMYFVFLMLFVIRAICLYCFGSAIISFLLVILVPIVYPNERLWFIITIGTLFYRFIGKPIFFKLDPEYIHVNMVKTGELLGNTPFVSNILSSIFTKDYPMLRQNLHDIPYNSPIGLAAGFDYEARLTKILGSIGFGFQTVGTITNNEYEGNPRPLLGRLPKSRSLMVNKGYKNPGADAVIQKLNHSKFSIPVGISIGRTNSRTKGLSQQQSVDDICKALEKFERSSVPHRYYELNISCPNLYGTVNFYSSKNLSELLKAIDGLHVTRPIFVKMPISKSLTETREMLKVISRYSPIGVIIGNLQTNRRNKLLVPAEVAKFPVGNFSGKPTFDDSNERISMCYTTFGKRFTIIGCGGVFSGADAFEKIRRGASLVQLITGMIYEGPQLITQINLELEDLLKSKGYKSISDAIGSGM